MSDPSAKERRRRKRGGALAEVPWLGISLLIHALVLAALIAWANPFDRDPTADAINDRDIVMSGDRLAELVDKVRKIQQRELQNRLDELQAIEYQMEDMRKDLNQPYREFSQTLAEQAMDKALDAQKKALIKQTESLEKQVLDNVEAAKQDQIEAVEAQDEALARMVVSPSADDAISAQEAAQEAQRQADMALDALRQAQQDLESTSKSTEQNLVNKQRELVKEQQAQTYAQRKLIERQQQQAKQESQLAKATSTGVAKAIQRATDVLGSAKHQTQEAANKVAAREAGIVKRQQDITARKAARDQQLVAKASAVGSAKTAALEAQQQALAMQQQALARATEAKEVGTSIPAKAQDIPQPDMSQAYTAPQNLAGTYAAAAQTEQRIAQRFQDLRAAELAMIRDISVDQAKAIIEIPKPDRANLNAGLLGKAIRDDSEIPAHEAEIEKALAESAAMVNLANDLMSQLQQQQYSAQQGHNIGAMRTAAQQQAAVEAQVAEGDSAGSADVTGLMKMSADPAGGAQAEEGGIDRAQLVSYNAPHEIIVKEDNPVPGRIISRRPDIPGAEWMYVDSWYTIGPFPNEGRRNIDTRFPPESVVDLDANYAGKGGRPISWHFIQASNPKVIPVDDESWAIYYAYSEVTSEAPLDLWMAVGSDDKSHIWINDVLVWVSRPEHKGWAIGEGYRKIHLQQGRNRILYRIENGHFSMGFSLIFHTDPEKVER